MERWLLILTLPWFETKELVFVRGLPKADDERVAPLEEGFIKAADWSTPHAASNAIAKMAFRY